MIDCIARNLLLLTEKMYNLLNLSASQTTTANVHSGKQVPVEASGFMAGSEPTIKRTALTKYDSVPFVQRAVQKNRIVRERHITNT